MPFKAIKEIGGFKEGEIVPDEKALVWEKMYAIPHVKKISENEAKVIKEGKSIEEESKEEPSEPLESDDDSLDSEDILDDYLGRNTNVVSKNIKEDELESATLEKLLKKEKEGKNRSKVIKAIESRLKEVG